MKSNYSPQRSQNSLPQRSLKINKKEMKNILIVDDDEVIVFLLKELFESEGFFVKTAFDGEDALKKIYENGLDIILLDIRMPKVNGYDVCQDLKEHKNNTPIIIITAHSIDEAKLRLCGIDIKNYIEKPFNPSDLINKVKALYQNKNG